MSKFDSQKHHRHSIRLPNYDYSQPGAYFVTLVAWHREYLFGEVINREIKLNEAGKIVQWEWLELPKRFCFIELGAFVVMPNHFHGIPIFYKNVGVTRQCATNAHSGKVSVPRVDIEGIDGSPLPRGPQPASLGAIMAQFKSRVTKRLWKIPSLQGTPIWQRNYGACPELVEGNISFATNAISKPKRITSKRIPCYGTRMMKIP
jgi:putative transposase